nr:MAG TPA: hypothetical protein [Caudoviricetes sp.]
MLTERSRSILAEFLKATAISLSRTISVTYSR